MTAPTERQMASCDLNLEFVRWLSPQIKTVIVVQQDDGFPAIVLYDTPQTVQSALDDAASGEEPAAKPAGILPVFSDDSSVCRDEEFMAATDQVMKGDDPTKVWYAVDAWIRKTFPKADVLQSCVELYCV